MLVRRLLMPFVLVTGMLVVTVPASAGPRTDASFVRATNADRREEGRKAMASSHTLAKLARSHSVAMARKSAKRYGGRCDARALWHNDISKSTDHWVWLGQNVGCGSMGSDGSPPRSAASRTPSCTCPATGATSCTARPTWSGPAPSSSTASSG